MKNFELHKENLISKDPVLRALSKKLFEESFNLLSMSQINDLYLCNYPGKELFFSKEIINKKIFDKALEEKIAFVDYLPIMRKNNPQLLNYFKLLNPSKDRRIIEKYIEGKYMFIEDRLLDYYLENKEVSPYFLFNCEESKLKQYVLELDARKNYEELKKYVAHHKPNVFLTKNASNYSQKLIDMLIEKDCFYLFYLGLSDQEKIQYIEKEDFIVNSELLRVEVKSVAVQEVLFKKYIDTHLFKEDMGVDLLLISTKLLSYAIDNVEKDVFKKLLSKKVKAKLSNSGQYASEHVYNINKLQDIVYKLDKNNQVDKKEKIELLLNNFESLIYEPVTRNYYLTEIVRDFLELSLPSCDIMFDYITGKKYDNMKKSLIIKNIIKTPLEKINQESLSGFTPEELYYILENNKSDFTEDKKAFLYTFLEKRQLSQLIEQSNINKSALKI